VGLLVRTRWRIVLPIVTGLLFVVLCFAGSRQRGIVDLGRWGPSVENPGGWGTEPTDIGTPADILLVAFNLPALIALVPLFPLTNWIESEFLLRSAWGLAAIGQWFLIGRYFDVRRGVLPAGQRAYQPGSKKACSA
jgi:hypothetical protein